MADLGSGSDRWLHSLHQLQGDAHNQFIYLFKYVFIWFWCSATAVNRGMMLSSCPSKTISRERLEGKRWQWLKVEPIRFWWPKVEVLCCDVTWWSYDIWYRNRSEVIFCEKRVSHSSGRATWLVRRGIKPQGGNSSLFVYLAFITWLRWSIIQFLIKSTSGLLCCGGDMVQLLLSGALCRATWVLQSLLSGRNS